ncbi:MAG: hypothetical protein M5U26_03430 [Planctomycetota bacterium]|nr:hypothetical protein [Planctomycetota bacterium]
MRTICCALLLAAVLGPSARGADDTPVCTVVRLDDGREFRGVVLDETAREIVLRTWTGDKRIQRNVIVDLRRNLSAEERAAILRAADPWKGYAEWQERDKAFAGGAKVDTPKVIDVPDPRRAPAVPSPAVAENVHVSGRAAALGIGREASWGERMVAGLNKRVTLELVDDKLEDAVNLIAQLTGLNLVISPKVREAAPRVTLNVKSMDAGNVLNWLARLTETHVELHDQALFITDKPSKDGDDAERNEILTLMAASGVDMNLMPPGDMPLTEQDKTKIAMAIFEKTNPVPTDFPGPEIGLIGAGGDNGPVNPFAARP